MGTDVVLFDVLVDRSEVIVLFVGLAGVDIYMIAES